MKFIKPYQKHNEELVSNKFKCDVCGSDLYRTDKGGKKITLQCSSDDAKFWNFSRGSVEQGKSHEHFMKSTKYVSKKEYNLKNQ